MEIKTLEGVQFSEIHKAFTKAFVDYELPSMSIEQLKQMLTRRGFVQDLSLGAFENDEIISFTFNGIGHWNGELTAYDTGTATVKKFRGQGLARKIFNETVSVLKEEGVSQYLLEVLQHNDKAVNLYKSMGFEVSREFDYFVADIKNLKIRKSNEDGILIKEIELPDQKIVDHFWNFNPSWQNSFDSIKRTPKKIVSFGAFMDDRLVGYAITEFDSGDITQLAVHKKYRRQGVGTELLWKLIQKFSINTIKIINTDSSDIIIKSFLKSFGIDISGKQFEMIKSL